MEGTARRGGAALKRSQKSTDLTRSRMTRDRIAVWARENSERRRVAFMQSQQQRRLALAAHEREGLHLLRLPELAEDLYELTPPCL
jgi:hypothetical protein